MKKTKKAVLLFIGLLSQGNQKLKDFFLIDFSMENATTYLTTWGCSPNVTDTESGLTPLHLAVISGNPRVVRRLLIKGADKTMKVFRINFLKMC